MAGVASFSSWFINESDLENQSLLAVIWRLGLRSWKKRFARFRSKVRNGVYPAHLESLWVIMGLITSLHCSSFKLPYDSVNQLVINMPRSTMEWQIVSCFLLALIVWLLICFVMRYTLKLLLMYKGFLSETPGKRVSLPTKLWGGLVKVFVSWNTPSLFSFQGSLPHLPLPSVSSTVKRYLRSVRPLLDDNSYEKVVEQSKEFENGIGKKLQWYLWLKSWWSSNYVSDWWEEYVYLRNRESLMCGSNYYGSDLIKPEAIKQTARAASLIYLMLQFRRKIERQELKPIMVQGLVPLCSWQYERMFNTVRVPGVEGDKIVHYNDIKHIVVLHKGCYYKMMIYHKTRLLSASELQYQLDLIVKGGEKYLAWSNVEKNLASLTALNRTKWAETRKKFFAKGVNKVSLDEIESSAFIVVLDDEPLTFGLNSSPKEYGYYGRQLLHGQGYDRWFDKSFNLCVGTNGRSGVNGEHTWADALVVAQMYEDCLVDDLKSYDEHGNLKGSIGFKPPQPTRLTWDFSDAELITTIDEAFKNARKIIDDVDHQIVLHNAFGKGFIKTCRLSPDAYIQMALQLAYYRDFGKFSLTYEASMTRLFREGRTETVRACTIESAAWVKAMEDKTVTSAERIRLLDEACKRHQIGYQDAMCGRGIDRHLFCLYVVSKYLEIDSPFLKEALSEPWRLSTSQTPMGQTPKADFRKHPELVSASGGFAPVSRDGYSVSYIVSGENIIFFHVSSIKSCEVTDTDRFAKQIVKAMSDIKAMFEEFNDGKKLVK